MGGKASSNSQSFESFVKENQDEFFNELSNQDNKQKVDNINQSMLKAFQNFKYLIILTEKLQTVQHIWNKMNFSVGILNSTNNSIQVNQCMKYTFKSFSFGIIRLDPITCYHIIFFLNKSKVFLTIQEFLNRILLTLDPNDDELSSFVMSRESKPAQRSMKLDFPNPLLEPSIEQDLLQSSSCAFFQTSQSDFSIDSDFPPQNKKKDINNDSFHNSASGNQSEYNEEENKEEIPSLIEEEEELSKSNSSDAIIFAKAIKQKNPNSFKKEKLPNKKKSNQASSNKKNNQHRTKKQNLTQFDNSEENSDYYSDDNNKVNPISTKIHSSTKTKEIPGQKSETDHLSSLFNFSNADSPSAFNRNKSTDICIDFNDQSSSTNIQQIKNWLPKNNANDKTKRKKRKNSTLKNNKKRKSSPQKTNKSNQNSTIIQNSNVHINLASDFDKSIRLNNDNNDNNNKTKRAVSPTRRQKKKIVKSSRRKKDQKINPTPKNTLGTLTSDFEMNSLISKQASLMTFKHDFNDSYEEEENSSEIDTKPQPNSKIINKSLVNNSSKNIKNNNSNESDDFYEINTSIKKENVEINNENDGILIIHSSKNEKKTRIRRRKKRSPNKKENNNETTNYLDSNHQTDDEMNKNLQLRIPKIYEKKTMTNFSEIKLEQLSSNFDFSTSSAASKRTVFQDQNTNLQKSQKQVLSNKSLGQLGSDFEVSTSSTIDNKKQNLEQKNKNGQNHTPSNNVTNDFDLKASKIQRSNNRKDHLELENNSLDLNSDFHMKNESVKQNKRAHKKKSNLKNSILEENNTDLNKTQNRRPNVTQRKRIPQNKGKNSSKQNSNLHGQNETNHSKTDLGCLPSDFSSNI